MNRNKSKLDEIYFDSSTVYFKESFSREGLGVPGYSKDAKFKEDQIVMIMRVTKMVFQFICKSFQEKTRAIQEQ